MQQEQGNLYQFLKPVTPVVIFQSKSCHDSIFSWFCRFEVSLITLIKSHPAYCLILIQSLVNFPPIPQICSADQIRGIGGFFPM